MKVTEKQLLIMFRVLEGSLTIADGKMGLFGYPVEVREQIFSQVINQQSDEIIDVKDTQEMEDEN